ncbi:ATP-binding protein [Vibrio ostreicida]|uniref:PAS domain-containing sensor histidine kinase n=1 Tax=Vibrio ostreicida TaxID=526588 RepID=UPI003B5A3B97
MKFPFASKFSDTSANPTDSSQDEAKIHTQVLDLLSEGVVICQGESDTYTIVYANLAYLRYYNLQANQVLGRNLIEFYSHYLNDRHISALHSALVEVNSGQMEMCIDHDKGSGWLNVNLNLIEKKSNRFDVILSQSDISQIRKVREALKVSNKKLQKMVASQNHKINEQELQMGVMFEQAVDPLILLNPDMMVADINDAAVVLFQHEKTGLRGLALRSLLSETSEALVENTVSGIDSYQEVVLDDVIKVNRSDTVLTMSGAVRYILYKNQKHIVLTLRDISNQRGVQKELKRSQSELEEVVRSLNLATQAGEIGIWSWDFTTNDLVWDERMFDMYGVDPDHGENNYAMWQQRVIADDVVAAEQALTQARETLSRFHAEFRIQLPDGTLRWIKAAAEVLFAQDGNAPIGMRGVNIDITKEKTAQASISQKSDIAQADCKAKSLFLANMSEEIRAPLNGVMGMINLLNETPLNDQQTNVLATMKDSATALRHIINDILDFAKIEAGQISLDSSPVELQKLIERTLDVVCLDAQDKGVELYLTYDATLPKMIMSDSVRLSQVLLNLVDNAVKFTDSSEQVKGKIWVSASLNTHDISPCIEIIVEDNGVGMSEQQVEQWMTLFNQQDTRQRDLLSDTGLGLSISRSLLALMGGNITVDSRPKVGSRFYIELPFTEATSAPDDPTPSYINGTRILFVTNDQNIATFADINLSNYRCKTNCVSSLERAITVLECAENAGVTVDLILFGPDFYHYFESSPWQQTDAHLLENQKFLFLTRDTNVKSGLVSPGRYVMPCTPFKPSDLARAIGVIRGCISCEQRFSSAYRKAANRLDTRSADQTALVND